MNAFETNLEPSRRGFLQLGSAALIVAGIGCNSQPSPEAPKTQPSEGAGTTPAAATHIRCYWPKQEVINATWAPPKVAKGA